MRFFVTEREMLSIEAREYNRGLKAQEERPEKHVFSGLMSAIFGDGEEPETKLQAANRVAREAKAEMEQANARIVSIAKERDHAKMQMLEMQKLLNRAVESGTHYNQLYQSQRDANIALAATVGALSTVVTEKPKGHK